MLKGPLYLAFGEYHVPSNSSSWHCLLWGVRWVTSLECCESGQSVPLITSDLILLAQLPPEGCPLMPGPLGAGRADSSHHEPGSILSALDACLLTFLHRYYHLSFPFYISGNRGSWGLCALPKATQLT